MGKQTESLHSALEKALELINPLPCTRSGKRTKVAESCLKAFDGKFDDEGRPTFWYGLECRVPEGFCPSCRAYWLVAVARNEVFNFDRVAQLTERASDDLKHREKALNPEQFIAQQKAEAERVKAGLTDAQRAEIDAINRKARGEG